MGVDLLRTVSGHQCSSFGTVVSSEPSGLHAGKGIASGRMMTADPPGCRL